MHSNLAIQTRDARRTEDVGAVARFRFLMQERASLGAAWSASQKENANGKRHRVRALLAAANILVANKRKWRFGPDRPEQGGYHHGNRFDELDFD